MSYLVEYVNCKVCGSDRPHFLGFRGNLEYYGAPALSGNKEHMVTAVVSCRTCGFVYTNPKIAISIDNGFSFYANPKEYHSSCCADPLKIFNNTLSLIEEFVKHKGRLLDIGAGKGEFLSAAKGCGWEVYGVEPSGNFVQYAKEEYGVDIKNCNLEQAGFSDNFFDVVTLNMALEHIDEPSYLLPIIHKVLKEDGLLYVEVPNMDSGLLKLINLCYRFSGRDWSAFLSPLHPPYHCYGYGKRSLNYLYRLNGFRIKKFYVSGIGLRGFRYSASGNKLLKEIRDISAKVMGWLNQGDILIALAAKR